MSKLLPGTDVAVLNVSSNNDSQATESNFTVKYDHILGILVQPWFYRLTDVAQALQRWRQRVRPTKIQHLENATETR